MKERFVSLMLAIVMLAASLSACSGSTGTAGPGSEQPASRQEQAEKAEPGKTADLTGALNEAFGLSLEGSDDSIT